MLSCRFEQLHSDCLFIDNLPPNYDKTEELSEICQQTVKPVYFKVRNASNKFTCLVILNLSAIGSYSTCYDFLLIFQQFFLSAEFG